MWDLPCGMQDLLVAACGIFSCSRRTLSCSMWDLVPRPGIKPGPPALGARSLSHWTTREVPALLIDQDPGKGECLEGLSLSTSSHSAYRKTGNQKDEKFSPCPKVYHTVLQLPVIVLSPILNSRIPMKAGPVSTLFAFIFPSLAQCLAHSKDSRHVF